MRQVPYTVYQNNLSFKEQSEYLKYIERKIKREKKKKPIFFEMYSIVNETVNDYKADFYIHDYNRLTIETEGSRRFIWVVKKTGTNMISLDNNFLDEMEEEFIFFKNVKKQSHSVDNLRNVYLINLDNNTLIQIGLNDVHKEMFSNKYGNIIEYFEKRVKEMDSERYLKTKYLFNILMEKYRNQPPKRMVDSIVENPPKRVFEFNIDGESHRNFG